MIIPIKIIIPDGNVAVSGTTTDFALTKVIWCDKWSLSTVNVITSLLLIYPAGAVTSSTVYVPFGISVIVWASVVLTNLSITVPLISLTTSSAPANGALVSWSTFTIGIQLVLLPLLLYMNHQVSF